MTGLAYCLDDRWLAPGESVFAPSSGVIASGEGWFETLRVESGRPMFLSAHLERLAASINRSMGDEPAKLAVRAARRCLVTMQSRFSQFDSGRLRLLVSHDGDRDTQDFGGWQALGEWSAYRASSEALQSGIDVVIASFAHPGLGFLGKSTSYHWAQAARREAQARGASEALLVRDGLVVEAATGTLAWCHRGRWFVHESEAALASVTLAALRRAGVVLESGTLPISIRGGVAMIEVDGLILLSALRLAVAIRRCEGQALPSASDTAAAWRDALLACHLNDIADNPV